MATVEIIHFTGGGDGSRFREEQEFAARLLVFTKNTRLQMDGTSFATYLKKPWREIVKELDYMAGTIPSSWEFVDVTFALGGVSRACAQQITRTRFTPMDSDMFGSYAMQSMRVAEIAPTFHLNPELTHPERVFMHSAHMQSLQAYKDALTAGISQEDARGLLPLDTHCNLVVKYNLRQLVELLRSRESLRVQGEYADLAATMKTFVIDIWPWSETFFEPKEKKAIKMIEGVALTLKSEDRNGANKPLATELAKAIDLLKKA